MAAFKLCHWVLNKTVFRTRLAIPNLDTDEAQHCNCFTMPMCSILFSFCLASVFLISCQTEGEYHICYIHNRDFCCCFAALSTRPPDAKCFCAVVQLLQRRRYAGDAPIQECPWGPALCFSRLWSSGWGTQKLNFKDLIPSLGFPAPTPPYQRGWINCVQKYPKSIKTCITILQGAHVVHHTE